MLTRRDVLIGAAGAVALVRQGGGRMTVPKGACDSHIHIIGDRTRWPLANSRVYTPAEAVVAQARAFHKSLGIERTVLIQPSVYGADNSCMLDALKQLGPAARAVAVIDQTVMDTEVEDMDRAGVRGVRINLETAGQTDPYVARQRLQAAIARIGSRTRWHVQVFTRPSVIDGVRDVVESSPIPIVFDHFGGATASNTLNQLGFATLVDLVRLGKAYVKISGAYRNSTAAPDYADVAPFAQALIAANIDRVLWGTDWPHVDSAPKAGRLLTDTAPHLPIDDARLLNQLAVWAPDPAQRQKILVDNPAKLYGF